MQPTQLISGESADGIFDYVLGDTVSTFAADTISRREVMLPSFQGGDPISGGGQTQLDKDVVTALAGPATPAKVTISVDAEGLEPQDSISADGKLYADGSAHRILSDLSALMVRPDHRLVVAGD